MFTKMKDGITQFISKYEKKKMWEYTIKRIQAEHIQRNTAIRIGA